MTDIPGRRTTRQRARVRHVPQALALTVLRSGQSGTYGVSMRLTQWSGSIGNLQGLYGAMGCNDPAIQAQVKKLICDSRKRRKSPHSTRVSVVIVWDARGISGKSRVVYL